MLDISWGEILVVGAVGVALTGKKDLPAACRFVGTQVGRLVGLLQGARARADRFAQANELRQLQNELRSGLRELDQVKMELAVAASSRGVIGRTLGATTASANRLRSPSATDHNNASPQRPPIRPPVAPSSSQSPSVRTPLATGSSSILAASTTATTAAAAAAAPTRNDLFDVQIVDNDDTLAPPTPTTNNNNNNLNLPPAIQTERAVMEEEWEKQGIGFRAIAEKGQWEDSFCGGYSNNTSAGGILDTSKATGSELLERLERQCLIFDQYDRVVAERDAAMEERIQQRLKKDVNIKSKKKSS